MSISRRDVLKLGASSATAFFLPTTLLAALESMAISSRKTLSIVQGATDETKTQFSIVHLQELSLRIEVWMGGSRVDPDEINTYSFEGQRTSVTQAFFSNLRSGIDLNLIIKNDSGKILDQRIFQTLANQGDLSFGILSCMHDAQHRADIWHDIASKKPNVLFFIGDSTYADSEVRANEARPETLWRRFAEARDFRDLSFTSFDSDYSRMGRS
ncbi:MAG: hypothetical protein M9962_03315 [Oligoflexia bacterium]|nr:hypothetical protein [Oligoflexia bacterium]